MLRKISVMAYILEFCYNNYVLQTVSGRYVSQQFYPENGKFSLTFVANVTLAAHPTIIFVNEKLHYPYGYNVG